MSRIGRLPIPVPSGVEVTLDGQQVSVKGPKGTLAHSVAEPITVERAENGELAVSRPDDERMSRSLHGLTRTLVSNMVTGVTDGYEKKLEIVGVGYRVITKGPTELEFALGFSHPVKVKAPRASPSPSRRRPGSPCWASTSSRSVRSRPTSASCASPSRTRARASGTRASTSAARSERLVSSHGGLTVGPQGDGGPDRSRLRRQLRGRKKVFGAPERPRLVVTRSGRHISRR